MAAPNLFWSGGLAGATPHEHVPHEHIPHTSTALKDIATFTSTFNAPLSKPGESTVHRKDVVRVRLASSLPPRNTLSAPAVIIAAFLILLGCLAYPIRKARRRPAVDPALAVRERRMTADGVEEMDNGLTGQGSHALTEEMTQ
jgi:hypothetical protein